jgi:hypothetical protein
MKKISLKKIPASIFALAAIFFLTAPPPADASLSAKSAFTLLEKAPPGEDLAAAKKFLGPASYERDADAKLGMKILRWGSPEDSWRLEMLHDIDTVRATRIIWKTKTLREQQNIFSQLTTEGNRFFGTRASFSGKNAAEWSDFDGRWIVRATLEGEVRKGVTLLSGIRDAVMGSEQYGF